MKIGVISDIHIDVNRDFPISDLLAEAAQRKELSCLAIAGDISNDANQSSDFVAKLSQDSGIPVYFIPGNHDFWSANGSETETWRIWEQYRAHPACLSGKQITLKADWVLIGEPGWYDYSFGNPRFSQADFEKKTQYGRTWQDSVHVNWGRSDLEVHQMMMEHLEQRLLAARDKQVIALVHMIGRKEFTVPESWPQWDYFNAFLGSKQYGELLEHFGVRYAVMGHVHFRHTVQSGNTTFYCACLNYQTQWRNGDPATEIEQTLQVLEIS